MKFKEIEDDVAILGEVKRNTVSIDSANIDFIVNILATNLYSNPIASFIRETVSNAWDSHIEAGIDKPVLLEIKKSLEGTYYCRIQDFGVGLSPERFNETYRNIGSSTKRGTNALIGGFGIGKFSALACSDAVYLTSNYEGVQYKYMMYKDRSSLFIDLIHEQKTIEGNGLEVQIDIEEHDVYNFYNAIDNQLVYFENLYVDFENEEREDNFNNFVVKKYTNFQVNSMHGNDGGRSLTIGKVRYPLRFDSLTSKYKNTIKIYPICLTFGIGELEVTPNREELLYTSENIRIIEKKIEAAYEEIQKLIKDNLYKDYTKITEYVDNIGKDQFLYLSEVDETIGKSVWIRLNKTGITYRGVKYDENTFRSIYNRIAAVNLIPISYTNSGGRIYSKKHMTNINSIINNFNNYCYANVSEFSNVTKEYVRDTDYTMYFIPHINIDETIKQYLRDSASLEGRYGNSFDMSIFKLIIKYFLSGFSNIKTLENKDVPKEWLKERKERQKEKKKSRILNTTDWSQNISLNILRKAEKGWRKITSDTVTYNLGELIKFKKLSIYSHKGDEKFRDMFYILKKHVKLIEVAPTKIKLLKNVKHFVKFEDFMKKKYRLLRNLVTAEYIKRNFPHIIEFRNIDNIELISSKLKGISNVLFEFYNKYSEDNYFRSNRGKSPSALEEVYELFENKNYFNQEIIGLINENKKLIENSKVLLLFVEDKTYNSKIPIERFNIITDYILARRLFRPNFERVNAKNKETIFNIKEEPSTEVDSN